MNLFSEYRNKINITFMYWKKYSDIRIIAKLYLYQSMFSVQNFRVTDIQWLFNAAFIIHRSLIIHHWSYTTHHPTLMMHHSSYTTHHTQLVYTARHTPLIIHPSSYTTHHPSYTTHHTLIIHHWWDDSAFAAGAALFGPPCADLVGAVFCEPPWQDCVAGAAPPSTFCEPPC